MTLTTIGHQRISSPTNTDFTHQGSAESALPSTRNQATNPRNTTRAGIPMPSASSPARTEAGHGA